MLLRMTLAPIVGLHLAIVVIVWIYFPIAFLLNPALAAEHAPTLNDWFMKSVGIHYLTAVFGSIFALFLGAPVAVVLGFPVFLIQRKIGLLGPISFGAVGLILGFLCAGIYYQGHAAASAGLYGPYNHTLELFMVTSVLFGWLFVWFASRTEIRTASL